MGSKHRKKNCVHAHISDTHTQIKQTNKKTMIPEMCCVCLCDTYYMLRTIRLKEHSLKPNKEEIFPQGTLGLSIL